MFQSHNWKHADSSISHPGRTGNQQGPGGSITRPKAQQPATPPRQEWPPRQRAQRANVQSTGTRVATPPSDGHPMTPQSHISWRAITTVAHLREKGSGRAPGGVPLTRGPSSQPFPSPRSNCLRHGRNALTYRAQIQEWQRHDHGPGGEQYDPNFGTVHHRRMVSPDPQRGSQTSGEYHRPGQG